MDRHVKSSSYQARTQSILDRNLTGIIIPAGGPRLVTNLLVTLKVRRGGGEGERCPAQRQAAFCSALTLDLSASRLPIGIAALPARLPPACLPPRCCGSITRAPCQ